MSEWFDAHGQCPAGLSCSVVRSQPGACRFTVSECYSYGYRPCRPDVKASA